MRSAKIVIMVPALSDTSRPPNRIRINVNPYSQNPFNITSSLPSAEAIANEVLRSDNPIIKVFEEIASNYSLPQINAMPSSLGKSFKVLSDISKVLSNLPVDQKSDVKAKLQEAFHEFYQNNLNLPSATAEGSATEIANALTNGPDAVLELKNLVRETPLAKQLGSDVMRLINSKENNTTVLAKQLSDSGTRAQVTVKPTRAKQPIVPDRSTQVKILHTPA
jgi:hypothetical protein